MAFISTEPVSTAKDRVHKLYEKNQADMGYVPNYVKLFSHRPSVMTGWEKLSGSIRVNMDPRRYELITLAAARALRSSYCSLAHGTVLSQDFYPPEELKNIAADFTDADLAPADVAIMSFAERVVHDATAITAEDIENLRQHGLSDTEIFDVAAAASARCFFSKLLDALGAEPDAPYIELNEELRHHLVVGRPISQAEVEQL